MDITDLLLINADFITRPNETYFSFSVTFRLVTGGGVGWGGGRIGPVRGEAAPSN